MTYGTVPYPPAGLRPGSTPEASGSGRSDLSQMRRAAALIGSLIVFTLSAFLGLLNDYLGVGILTALLLIGFYDGGRSSLASIIVFSGISLSTLPYTALIFVEHPVQTAWFALFIVVGLVLTAYGEPAMRMDRKVGRQSSDLLMIMAFLIAGILLWRNEGILQISFYAGWACALVHLERINANSTSLQYRWAGLLVFALVIGYFSLFLWEGGGRILQLSFGFAPLFVAMVYRSFRLNVVALAIAAIALSFVGRVLRFGWSGGLAGLSVDSGASPITLTSWLWETGEVVVVPGSIYEQWLLLFTNWLPRDLWPGKPLGIGRTFVDLVLGREGYSLDHNVALGYFGEHIFYLPNTWILSVALLTIIIIFARRMLIRYCSPYYAPVIAFDVWLITLFWGGMAAYAARVWFAMLPMIAYIIFIKWLDRAAAAGPKDRLITAS